MTKKIQKKISIRRSAKTVSENQFGVILENINSKLGLLVEGHATLDEKFDKKIDDFKEEFIEFKRDTEGNFKTILRHLLNIDEELEFIKII